jgi:hypothetical protein
MGQPDLVAACLLSAPSLEDTEAVVELLQPRVRQLTTRGVARRGYCAMQTVAALTGPHPHLIRAEGH